MSNCFFVVGKRCSMVRVKSYSSVTNYMNTTTENMCLENVIFFRGNK